MKPKFWIFALLFAAAIAIVYFAFRKAEKAKELPDTPPSVQTSGNSAAGPAPTTPTNSLAPVAAGDPVSHVTNDRDKPELFRESIENKNAPVEFYGKIIDQDNNPVPGAKVSVGIRQWYVRSIAAFDAGAHIIPVEVESGEDGRFEVHGKKGDGFGVGIMKEGYQLSPKAPKGFGPVAGSVDAPILFKMWKTGDPAKLVSQDKDTRIPYDGTSVVFDLITGQKNAGDSTAGDLRVTLTRDPLNIPLGYKNSFDWHASIEAIGGGVVLSEDEFMYMAPENGYQPKLQIDMPASATNWANIYNVALYTKTRNGGVYSRVKLEFRVDSPKPQTGLSISSASNPTGSRNLQP